MAVNPKIFCLNYLDYQNYIKDLMSFDKLRHESAIC